MKKLLMLSLAAILVASFASVSSAQVGPIGIKAGMNMADITGDAENTDMKAGLVVGAFAELNLGMVNIQPELLYSMKGAKSDDISNEYNYFEIPVLVKYKLPLPGKLTPSVYAGPVFSLLLSAESDGNDIKDQLKNNDIGIIIGAGINMDMSSYVLTFDARYNMGLSDINNLDDALPGSEDEFKNSTIMLMAGIGFNLPGK